MLATFPQANSPQESPVSTGFPIDFKEQVRQAVDLVDLVGSFIELRRQGRNYVGLCPWHDDRKPSLNVMPERQTWKCWVCDIGGDCFNFVMQREGVSFPEALRMLAEDAGIAVPSSMGATAGGGTDEKRSLLRVLAWAERQFHHCLLESTVAAPARDYLKERGITDESVRRFHLGFAPQEWRWLLGRARAEKLSERELESLGLIRADGQGSGYHDAFRGRLMFSIRDTQHRPIAFGGRILPQFADDRSPKYINSPESRVFKKAQQLYGLDQAVTGPRPPVLHVMEGYTDVVMAHQIGLDSAVAVLGTALGESHLKLLRRFTDQVVLVLDGDEAGQRRANEVLGLFVAAEVNVRIMSLPAGMDPCDFLRERGLEAFVQLAADAPDAVEHRLQRARGVVDPRRDTHGASEEVEGILETLAKAPRLSQEGSKSALREDHILRRLAREFDADEDLLRRRLRELRGRERLRSSPKSATEEEGKGRLPVREECLLELVLCHAGVAADAVRQLNDSDLEDPRTKRILHAVGELIAGGQPPAFDRIMTAIEEPELKNLLVALEVQGTEKSARAEDAPERRWQSIWNDFQDSRHQHEQQARLARITGGEVDPNHELDTLKELIDKERQRRGITLPTDG